MALAGPIQITKDAVQRSDRYHVSSVNDVVMSWGKDDTNGLFRLDHKWFGTASTKYMHLDASADKLLFVELSMVFGHSASQVVSDGDGATNLTPGYQFLGTAKADSSILIGSWNTTNDRTVSPSLNFLKSGSGTIGSSVLVESGETLGEVTWFGDDGADYEAPAASIRAEVDATAAAGDMPGRLVFLTTADAGEVLTEALRITSAQDVRVNDGGGLIVGSTTAQITISDGDGATNLVPEVQVLGTTKADGSMLLMVNSATATSALAPSLNFVKSAHATLGSNTVVASGEVLGEVNFFGADGTDFESCAVSIRGVVNTTAGAGDMPGRLSIFTSTDGAETPTERVRITGTATASTLALGVAGATTGTLTLAGTTSGVVTINPAAAAGTYSWELPGAQGASSEQLTNNGSGVLTWAGAGSSREIKNLLGYLDPIEGLRRMLSAPVHRFTYKQDAHVDDKETMYYGIVSDEAPWAMKAAGKMFNPINAFGHTVAAVQALYAELTEVKAKLAAIGA